MLTQFSVNWSQSLPNCSHSFTCCSIEESNEVGNNDVCTWRDDDVVDVLPDVLSEVRRVELEDAFVDEDT